MPAPFLRLSNVSRTFQTGDVPLQVLRDVDLEIFSDEFCVIVGPSGSGKSTLMNLLGGLDQPSGGEIWRGDFALHDANRRALTRYRRRDVGFVFQFYNLIPTLTAQENILTAAELVADPRDADELLALVGLAERQGHFPAQLSGGEQQRVAIARALVKRPKLLLCDEPTGALDVAAGRAVLQLLVEVHEQSGAAVVLITHNQAISEIADRVAVLRDGTIVENRVNEHPKSPAEAAW